jgi:lipoprotein-anchoring transpeptidase ErfK/SrfK
VTRAASYRVLSIRRSAVSNTHVRLRARGIALAAVLVLVVHRGAWAQTGPAVYQLLPHSLEAQRRLTPSQLGILEKLNRRDAEHLARLTDIIVPEVWSDDELTYSPLPSEWAFAQAHPKLIVVDVPAQVFGAYEAGRLVRWGPVSTGREQSQTPAGVYALTWRSKSRRSTDNAEWILKWYFNFINARGVSFHEFELPGRPASHACVRLLERDAKWIYDWGQQWKLNPDKRRVDEPGSTVVILGAYDYKQSPPWLALAWWANRLDLPASIR